MSKRRFSVLAIGFSVLVGLLVILLAVNSLRRSSHIVLPRPESSSSEEGNGSGSDGIVRLEVTPDTVQAVIATLSRPERYGRILRLESFWSGGSAVTQVSVRVDGDWSRTDLTRPSKQVRHTITDGKTTWIWYNSERNVYTAAAGDISPDEEQQIPTYEDILLLDPESITQADYRSLGDIPCVYVETAESENGYVQRYWVSVETGLLAGAERLQNGETVYRMSEQADETVSVSEADFKLPDGTALRND